MLITAQLVDQTGFLALFCLFVCLFFVCLFVCLFGFFFLFCFVLFFWSVFNCGVIASRTSARISCGRSNRSDCMHHTQQVIIYRFWLNNKGKTSSAKPYPFQWTSIETVTVFQRRKESNVLNQIILLRFTDLKGYACLCPVDSKSIVKEKWYGGWLSFNDVWGKENIKKETQSKFELFCFIILWHYLTHLPRFKRIPVFLNHHHHHHNHQFLNARVVGAPQMILQPVFSIFPRSLLSSGTCRTPGPSIPWCCLLTYSSALSL